MNDHLRIKKVFYLGGLGALGCLGSRGILILGLFFSLLSCTRLSTLNLRGHHYGALPTRIIWIQVAGLQDEHLAMLRFFRPTVQDITSFEKVGCIGKTWGFNLYEIRPKAYEGLLSQLTGKKNIKGDCSDFSHTPVWKYLEANGYQTAIFESGTNEHTGIDQPQCGEESKKFLNQATLWSMRAASSKGPEFFHAQEQKVYHKGHIYYDQSCQNQGCYTDLQRNIEHIFKVFLKNQSQYLFLVRDFSFLKQLQEKNMLKAREVLLEIEKIFEFFLQNQKTDREMLILLTSSGALNVEFPEGGPEWSSFEEKGAPVIYKSSSLLSPVFAKGARAENFCGIYEEVEILSRITKPPPKVGF